MSAVKVLIIGINYAPELIGVAPYTTGVAASLAARGYQVQVLTGYPHYPDWRRQRGATPFRSTEAIGGVKVRRFNHPVPQRFSWFRRAAMELLFGLQVTFSRWSSVDVVICVTPPLLTAALSVIRARLMPNRPSIGTVVQDIYSRGVFETEAASGIVAGAIRFVEALTLKMSDGVATIHTGFSRDLADTLGVDARRLREIRNWTHVAVPDPGESYSYRNSRGWGDDDIVVIHAGNMGYKQGLENVIAAAALADESNSAVRFVLVGDGNQRARLERLASGVKAIEFIHSVNDSNFPAVLGSADILLVNELPGVANMSVPSKLTSYFKAGKPILAAVDDHSYAAAEIRAAGAGICVHPGRGDLLLRAAERLGRDRDYAAQLGTAGRLYSDEFLSDSASLDLYEQWVIWLTELREARIKGRPV